METKNSIIESMGYFITMKGIKTMGIYEDLKAFASNIEHNPVWVRNKILLNEDCGNITYNQKEKLLAILENR